GPRLSLRYRVAWARSHALREPIMSFTPSQTVGPYFHFSLTANTELGCMATPESTGERIQLGIRLFDGDGAPVQDGIIELWQADGEGEYNTPGFCGFGRLGTDANGECVFRTVLPGRVCDGKGGYQSAHINVTVFARGLLAHLHTRIYFEADSTLAGDPVL